MKPSKISTFNVIMMALTIITIITVILVVNANTSRHYMIYVPLNIKLLTYSLSLLKISICSC